MFICQGFLAILKFMDVIGRQVGGLLPHDRQDHPIISQMHDAPDPQHGC